MNKPVSRRELNKERRRNAILDAARAGFARDGVQGTTMDDIAREAQVSRTTLFNYFTGKGEILDHLVMEMHEHFFARIEECRNATTDVGERVMLAFVKTGQVMDAGAEKLRPLVGYSELGWNEAGVLERMERLTTGFESLLEGGDTQFAPDAPDPRAIAEIMTGVFIGMVHNWRLTPGYPLEERLTEAAKWICVMLRRSPQG
ncbi:TetR/AcrR family transcriptional regulator [Caenibius sp. WL]|uniref:TetR/AcrR family transcriptional regulator n=1 Tax=Caenibius sp. WL TaxID=2872646 RepID=UPI001C99B1B0|nr:TetR/AcrR family transcriptional regulator [Caenibius sp. WL]QZP09232.1 TetR/AcrR family transcriptional regulator [Caenibius sp. WL]